MPIPHKISRLIAIYCWEEVAPTCSISQGHKNLQSRVSLEDGFTAGRILLQFLGINLSYSNLSGFEPRTKDDIMIDDIGGNKFTKCEIDNIPEKDAEVLKIFFKRANKGAAHLTKEREGEKDGHEILKDGIKIILDFLKTHYFEPINIPFDLDYEELFVSLDDVMIRFSN
jgi:hypothetical protein